MITCCSTCGNHAFELVRDRLYRCLECNAPYRMDAEGWLRGASPGVEEIAERKAEIRAEKVAASHG